MLAHLMQLQLFTPPARQPAAKQLVTCDAATEALSLVGSPCTGTGDPSFTSQGGGYHRQKPSTAAAQERQSAAPGLLARAGCDPRAGSATITPVSGLNTTVQAAPAPATVCWQLLIQTHTHRPGKLLRDTERQSRQCSHTVRGCTCAGPARQGSGPQSPAWAGTGPPWTAAGA